MKIEKDTCRAFSTIETDINYRMELAALMINQNATSELASEDPEMLVKMIDELLTVYKKLGKIKTHLGQLKEYLTDTSDEMNIDFGEDRSKSPERTNVLRKKNRQIEVDLTEGMINQNLLTLTHACKQGVARLGERFSLTMPNGELVTTELVSPGNRLKERGAFGRLYREQKARRGDKVILKEQERGQWEVHFDAGDGPDLSVF